MIEEAKKEISKSRFADRIAQTISDGLPLYQLRRTIIASWSSKYSKKNGTYCEDASNDHSISNHEAI